MTALLERIGYKRFAEQGSEPVQIKPGLAEKGKEVYAKITRFHQDRTLEVATLALIAVSGVAAVGLTVVAVRAYRHRQAMKIK